MAKQEQITAFLEGHITLPRMPTTYAHWGAAYPWTDTFPPGLGPRPTVEDAAHELLDIAEFRALQLGTWLGTTDGEVITRAVESVSPPFYRQDIELLVAALKHAASIQQQEGQQVAGRFALGAIGIASVVALAIASSGPSRAA